MRDQFAGDITDWIKFSLLRGLAGNDRSLGIAWYYIEDVADAEQEHLDPAVAQALAKLRERSVSALEELPIWKNNTKFFRKHVPRRQDRKRWLEEMKASLYESQIVFFDPDNGLGKPDALHATLEEIAAMRKPGRALVLIHFPSFAEKHDLQIASHHDALFQNAKTESLFTIKTRVTVHRQDPYGDGMPLQRSRWFTVIDGDDVIRKRAEDFVEKFKRIKGCSASIDPENKK